MESLDIIKRIHLIARANAVVDADKIKAVEACIMDSNRMVEVQKGLERIIGEQAQAVLS
jgi:hypothetical protein